MELTLPRVVLPRWCKLSDKSRRACITPVELAQPKESLTAEHLPLRREADRGKSLFWAQSEAVQEAGNVTESGTRRDVAARWLVLAPDAPPFGHKDACDLLQRENYLWGDPGAAFD